MKKSPSQSMDYVYNRVVSHIKEQKSLIGLCPNRQSILNELFDHCVTYQRNQVEGNQKSNSMTNVSSLEPLRYLSLTDYQLLYFKDLILKKLYEKVVDGSLQEFRLGNRRVDQFLPFSLRISQFLREFDSILESIERNQVPLSIAMMRQLELLISPDLDIKEGYWDENSVNAPSSSSQFDLTGARLNAEVATYLDTCLEDWDPSDQTSGRKRRKNSRHRNSDSREDIQTVNHMTRSKARDVDVPFVPESLTVRQRKTFNSKSVKRNPRKKRVSEEEEVWLKAFHAWIEYYDDHGTYDVPENEVVLMNDDDEEGIPLGKWLVTEKTNLDNYLQNDPERYELLAERLMTNLLESE